MAKRFTDTDKWKREWFTDLPLKAKMVWIYVLDNCDHCGVWHTNFKLMSFQLGESVSATEFDNWFGTKARRIEDNKYFIPSFVEFQYGELNSGNNAHKAVIELIKKIGPQEPLISPSGGAQDKDKDQDKDQDKENSEDTALEKRAIHSDLLALYKTYPLKKGKTKGLAACKTQIKTPADYDALKLAIEKYRDECQREAKEPKHIKQFSTFMTCWRDYLDDDVGTASVMPLNQNQSGLWDGQARSVLAALRQFPNWLESETEVRAFLGDDLFSIARKANTTELRRVPSGPFHTQNVIARLKDAEEVINAQKIGN